MELNSILLVIIIHRVGFILLIITSGVNVFLPIMFDRESDYEFAQKTYGKLLLVARLGILFLIITGPIRLSYNIPEYIIVKLILAFLVLLSFTILKVEYDDVKFKEKNIVRIVIVLITATTGLLI